MELSIEQLIAEDAETLFDRAPCGYLTTLMDGTIVRVNATFLDWTRYQREELIGRRRFVDLLSGGGRIYHETHFAPLLALQGALREVAFDVVRGDGTRLPVLINASVETLRDGSPVLVRLTMFEATMRREYERELVRARAEEREAREHLERVHADLAVQEHRSWLRAELSAALDTERDAPGRVARLVDLVRRELADEAWFVAAGTTQLVGSSSDATICDLVVRMSHATLPVQAGTSATSYLGLPLRVADRSLGHLLVARHTTQAFADDEVAFLADLASRAALSIENARLYEHERATAHALQQSLLTTKLPRGARFAIETFYRPAVDDLDVGGDWYDAFPLSGDRIAIVVGDVVGRGLGAASAMGQLRSAVRALAAAGFSPGALLDRLDVFVETDESGRYATLVYGDLDLARGVLRLASAGHPPIIIAEAASAQMCWRARSAPLGVAMPGGARPEAELPLAAGTRLLLFTDGIVERREASIDAGLEQLTAAVVRTAGVELKAMLASVVRDALRDSPADDDACALAVEVH